MKPLRTLLCVVGMLAVGSAVSVGRADAVGVPAPAGLVAWWRGESNAWDSVGSNHGTLLGNTVFGVGKVGQGFALDGDGSYVLVSNSPSLNPVGPFSIESWIYPTLDGTRRIMAKWGDQGAYGDSRSYMLTMQPGLSLQFGISDWAHQWDYAFQDFTVTNVVALNAWNHVAATYDSATGVRCIYVNGVKVGGRTNAPVVIYNSSTPATIGSWLRAPDFAQDVFQGMIDEVSFYNRALAGSEVEAIYGAGSAGKILSSQVASNFCVAYPNFNSINGINLFGSAATTNGVLRLTPAVAGQTGSVWLQGKVPCSGSFDTRFHFQITQLGNILGNEPGGDGFTFSVQNLSATNAAWAMGDTNHYVSVFFNTFWNWPGSSDLDLSGSSVGILVNQNYVGQADLSLLGIDMSDGGVHQARVLFDGAGLAVWVDNLQVLTNISLPGLQPGVDTSGLGWAGFTAGTGAAYENHDILDWSFCSSSPTNGLTNVPPELPLITSQPAAQNVAVSGATTFAVTASGTGPLSYQWQLNLTNLVGATNATLALNNVQLTNGGYYSVRVSSPYGATNSQAALLTVVVPPSVVPPPGLVAWWRGESNAWDSVGGNHGTLSGNTTYGSGKVGQEFVFNGNNGCGVALGSPASLQLSNLTVECWIKRSSPTVASYGSGGNGTIYGCGLIGYCFLVDWTGQLVFGHCVSNVKITDTNYHHVALTLTGGMAMVYLDGAAVSTPANNRGLTFAGLMGIGYRPDNQDNSFLGRIDEVGLYNRALTSNEIAGIYGAGSAGKTFIPELPVLTGQPTNRTVVVGDPVTFSVAASGTPPLSYQWTFNLTNIVGGTNSSLTLSSAQLAQAGNYSVTITGPGGSIASSNALLTVLVPTCTPAPAGLVSWWSAEGNALDQISGNHGTLVGGASYGAGKVGQGFVFNGMSSGIFVSNTPSLQLQDFTIETWVKRTSASVVSYVGAGDGCILVYGPGTTSPGGFMFFISAAGNLTFSQWGKSQILTGPSILDTNFHHVAVTKVGSAMAFYLDGVAYPMPAFSTSFNYTSNPGIGYRSDNQGNGLYGTIDEIAIYNRALAPNEIQAIYAARGAGKCFTPVPPTIIRQPTNRTAVVGDPVTFSVLASGTPPLSYQWTFNLTNLVGATNATLTLPGAQLTHAGNYQVRVSNATGSLLSSNAILTVLVPTCTPAPAGLVAWWQAEGNTRDIVGGSDGAWIGTASYTNGKSGLAFNFDGASRVQVPDSAAMHFTKAMTVEAWINLSTFSGVNSREIVSKLDGPNDNSKTFTFAIDPATKTAYFIVCTTNGVTGVVLGSTTIPLNQWVHLVGTYDGSTVKIYFNGQLDGSTPWTKDIFPGINPLVIGCTLQFTSSSPTSFFDGLIDEISLYNRALTTNEIAAIYAARGAGKSPLPPSITQQPTNQTVLVGDPATFSVTANGTPPLNYQWNCNLTNLVGATNATLTLSSAQLAQAGNYSVTVTGPGGSIASANALLTVLVPTCTPAPAGLVGWWPAEGNPLDSAGTNAGTWLQGASYAAGKVGQAFRFTNADQAIIIPDAPALNPANGLTLETWVLVERYPASGGGVVVAKNWPWAQLQYMISLDSVGGRWAFRSYIGIPYLAYIDSATAVQTNTWYHVVMTYDNATLKVFVNGQLNGSLPVIGSIIAATNPLVIGGYGQGQGPWTLPGRVDEVSLYNRALAPNEISALYAARGAGKCPLPPTVLNLNPTGWYVNEGATVTGTVTAVGSPALAYQWQYNGSEMSGETNASLTLSNVVYAQAGNYAVVVSNSSGSVTSSNVVLRVNRAPVADARATETLVISPNGTNAIVVLDGSRSGDPDGDALAYQWFAPGDTHPLAASVVAIQTLPVGTSQLVLLVNDGLASASQEFTVEVITTSQAVDRLIEWLQSGSSKAQPLVASLRAALAAIDRSQPETAIHQLEAFISKVRAQLLSSDAALAAQLIADAQAIIDALQGGSPALALPVEITSVSQPSPGKTHLKFKGAVGRVYVIEASANLVDWVPVGQAATTPEGAYEFDDPSSPAVGARFYRVVSPK